VWALFPHKLIRWYALRAQGVAVDDFADANFDHSGVDFIGGGSLRVYCDQRPTAAAGMPTFGRAPSWGSQWKTFVRENAGRWVNTCLQETTLPYEQNVLDLHPTCATRSATPSSASRRTTKTTSAASQSSHKTRWSSGPSKRA
jgi:hypothetical protein